MKFCDKEISDSESRAETVQRLLLEIGRILWMWFEYSSSNNENLRSSHDYSSLLWILLRSARIEAMDGGSYLPLILLHLLQAGGPVPARDHLTQASLCLQSVSCHLDTRVELLEPLYSALEYHSSLSEDLKMNAHMAHQFARAEYESNSTSCIQDLIYAERELLEFLSPPDFDLDRFADLLRSWQSCRCGCMGLGDEWPLPSLPKLLWECGDMFVGVLRHQDAHEAYEESLQICRRNPRFQYRLLHDLRKRSYTIKEAEPERSWALLRESINASRAIQGRGRHPKFLANSLKVLAMQAPDITPEERCCLLNEAITLLVEDFPNSLHDEQDEDASRLGRYFDIFADILDETDYLKASRRAVWASQCCHWRPIAEDQTPSPPRLPQADGHERNEPGCTSHPFNDRPQWMSSDQNAWNLYMAEFQEGSEGAEGFSALMYCYFPNFFHSPFSRKGWEEEERLIRDKWRFRYQHEEEDEEDFQYDLDGFLLGKQLIQA